MADSKLVSYENYTKNYSTRQWDGNLRFFVPHCVVGQFSAKGVVDMFTNTSRQASCNYAIGKDGEIGQSVPEKYRAWTTGGTKTVNGWTGAMVDHYGITVEIASDTYVPYKMNDAAITSLINLMVDVCQRYKKTEVIWLADASKTVKYNAKKTDLLLYVHRWAAAKDCPGDYLYNQLGSIADQVNAKLGKKTNYKEYDKGTTTVTTPTPTTKTATSSPITQEQFNTMMDNWLAAQAAKSATWEKDVMNWAVQEGLIQGGNNSNLMPKKPITRGEFLTVIKRLCDRLGMK